MKAADSLPKIEFFLAAFDEKCRDDTCGILSVQLALKCAICSDLEWMSFEESLRMMNFCGDLEHRIRLVGLIGRYQTRSPIQHLHAVAELRRFSPSDPFLLRPFCRSLE